MKKRNGLRKLALLLVTVLLLGLLSGCASSGVRKVISKFEKACQELDADTMLDCLNPTITNPLGDVLDFFGVDSLNSALSGVVKVLGVIDFKDDAPEDVLKTLKIKCKDFDFNDAKDACTVTAQLSYTVDGEKVEKTVHIKCEQVDDAWYIMSFGS